MQPGALIAQRYRVVRAIGGGGMGTVWEAEDERLHRRVALKQLHPQLGRSESDAALARDRAMREARITARLHHPNAVDVYDVVDVGGEPCLVMQFLPSASLQAILAERGTLPVPEVARIGAEVAAALNAAHEVGIVHRDVKPGNILIDHDGTARITDFGISHATGDVSLTSTGMLTGTPAFLSPEVARGAESNAASDVFSLGATLYTALEGSPPFGTGENPMATLHRVASGNLTPPRNGGPLTPLLLRMLAGRPDDRPSMEEIAGSLSRVASDSAADTVRLARSVPPPPDTHPTGAPATASLRRPRRRRGVLIGVGTAVVVAAAAVAAGVALSGSPSDRTPRRAAAGAPRTGTPPTSTAVRPSAPSTSAPPSSPSSSAGSPSSSSSSPSSAAPTTSSADLVRAINDYYSLLPDDTAAGWPHMTAQYQRDHAGGRSNYEQFWAPVDAVSVSGITADPPHDVTATLTYTMHNGQVITERTAFYLVRRQGMFKIARSTVLSSSGG